MGIEPTNKGFADIRPTTWLPRPSGEPLLAKQRGLTYEVTLRFPTVTPGHRT